MTTLFFPVLSGELEITVVLFGKYLSGCWCDMWEGNGVQKGEFGERFDSAYFCCLCVCS